MSELPIDAQLSPAPAAPGIAFSRRWFWGGVGVLLLLIVSSLVVAWQAQQSLPSFCVEELDKSITAPRNHAAIWRESNTLYGSIAEGDGAR